MRTVIVCLALTQVMLFGGSKQPGFKALIVYDSSTPNVQIASTADATRVKRAFALIAEKIGLKFHSTTLKADELSKHTLQAWLKSLSAKDIALFYYAGRGISVRKGYSKCPIIACGKGRISAEAIAKRLKRRKPKLRMIFLDCYNRPASAQPNIEYKFLPTFDELVVKEGSGWMNIFRRNRGFVLGYSCRNADKAFYSSQKQPIGGFFTTTLLSGLFDFSQNQHENWNVLDVYVGHTLSNVRIGKLPHILYHVHGGVMDNLKCIAPNSRGNV